MDKTTMKTASLQVMTLIALLAWNIPAFSETPPKDSIVKESGGVVKKVEENEKIEKVENFKKVENVGKFENVGIIGNAGKSENAGKIENGKEKETLVGHKLKDPTEPSEGLTVKKEVNPGENVEASLNLESILLSGDRKVAVINDKMFKENDVIGGYRIKEINITSVKLVPEGKEGHVVILPLLGSAMKETAQ